MPTRRTAAGMLCFTTFAAGALCAAGAHAAAAQTGPPAAAPRGTATITGVVTAGSSPAPVANAGVAVVDQGSNVVSGMQTTADGRFRIAGIPAGTYELRVRSVGRARYTTAITLKDGEQRTINVALTQANVNLDAVVVSASRKPEKITDAPADIQLARPATIQSTSATSIANAVKTLAGVDAFQQGAVAQTIVARGFNAIFGGIPFLVDYRPGAVPGLGLPALHAMPETSDDVARMELVLGPASALYGPNFNNGVLQIITRSPFDDQGIQVSAQGGSRDFAKGQIRLAHQIGDKFAAKLSASLLSLNEWAVDASDPYRAQEIAGRANYLATTHDSTSFVGQRIGVRPYGTRRATADGRIDVRPVEGLNLVTSAGYTKASYLEMTGLGTSANDGFLYGYAQTRATYSDVFAQLYSNFNDAPHTYRIPLGTLVQDFSRQSGAQLQFSPTYGRLSLVAGGDYQWNHPISNGTVYGRYEPQDRFTIAGAYAQGTYTLGPKIDLVASGRLDKHTFVQKTLFSPRGGIVFKPAADQAFRFTFNRAFATPAAINYFLDLNEANVPFVPGLVGSDIRLQAPPRGSGFTFPTDAQGRPYWYNDLTNPSSPKTQLPLTTTDAQSWAVIQQLITAYSKGAINGARLPVPGTQTAGGALPSVPLGLGILNTATQKFDPYTGALTNIAPLSATANNVFELGYKGVLARKLFLSVDVYSSRTRGLIGSPTLETPNVFASGTALAAYLQAVGVPAASATALATGVAKTPLGVVTPTQAFNRDAILFTTRQYPNAITVYGSDVSAEYALNGGFRVMGNYSYISRTTFLDVGGISTLNLYTNSPKNKFMLGTGYRDDSRGLDGELRFRHVEGFPVSSTIYIGSVKSYGLLDFNGSYRVPRARGARLTLQADNLLDNTTPQFVGAPSIGRFIAVGVGYDFGGTPER